MLNNNNSNKLPSLFKQHSLPPLVDQKFDKSLEELHRDKDKVDDNIINYKSALNKIKNAKVTNTIIIFLCTFTSTLSLTTIFLSGGRNTNTRVIRRRNSRREKEKTFGSKRTPSKKEIEVEGRRAQEILGTQYSNRPRKG